MAEIGHNSDAAHGVARDQLKSFIERVERLEEEKATIAEDIKSVFGEAKAMGFDGKVMKEILKLRKMDDTVRQEWEHLRDTYGHAVGIFG